MISNLFLNIIIGSILKIFIHHHLVVASARISLTLSRHLSLSFIAFGRSSGLHPVSCTFELVALFLLGNVKGSIGVHHLCARPDFSSCVLHLKKCKFMLYDRKKSLSNVLHTQNNGCNWRPREHSPDVIGAGTFFEMEKRGFCA